MREAYLQNSRFERFLVFQAKSKANASFNSHPYGFDCFNMLSRVAPRGGYILVNKSSVVNSILAKANHFCFKCPRNLR